MNFWNRFDYRFTKWVCVKKVHIIYSRRQMAFSQDILLWQNTPEKKNTIKEAVKWKTLCYTFKHIKYMVVVSYFYRTIGTWWVMWGISQHLHLLSSTLPFLVLNVRWVNLEASVKIYLCGPMMPGPPSCQTPMPASEYPIMIESFSVILLVLYYHHHVIIIKCHINTFYTVYNILGFHRSLWSWQST